MGARRQLCVESVPPQGRDGEEVQPAADGRHVSATVEHDGRHVAIGESLAETARYGSSRGFEPLNARI